MTKKINKIWLGGIALFFCAVAVVVFAAPSYALPNQVDGTVYFDQNNNGIQDVGEPGLAGLLVRYGTNSSAPQAITDTNGNYVLSGVSGTATVEVFTGWFRSQCNSLNCAAGPGTDNDFAVDNQFITATGVSGTAGATLDVGLIPDWDGQNTYSTYPAGGATVTGTATDVAARLSYNTGCSAGTTAQRLCNPGARVRFRVAIFNQGTSEMTNPVFALQAPVGHEIDDSSWFDNGQAIPTADTVTVLQAFDPQLGYGIYRLNGSLPAGASSTMFFEMDVLNTAIGSPQPYATADPRDKQMVAQVLQLDQTGDWDSQFCLESGQNWLYGTCALNPLGDHDATLASDHSDGATWNVTGTAEPRVDSMTIAATITNPTASMQVCQNGTSLTPMTVDLEVTNTSTGDTPLRNIEIAVDVPDGFVFNAADNPGWFIGGDSRPHAFVNLHILPNAVVNIPLSLAADSTFSLPPNSTMTLGVESEIVTYDTAQVAGAGQFTPGSMTGMLIANDDIEATSVGCPQQANGGDANTNEDDVLASTGMNMGLMGVVAVGMIVGGASLLMSRLRR
jgi:hypothetical protein